MSEGSVAKSISGKAVDQDKVSDVYITVTRLIRSKDKARIVGVDHKKVFYLAARPGSPVRELPFSAEIPLWPGSNRVSIVARRSDEIRTHHSFRILRSKCRGARPPARVVGRSEALPPGALGPFWRQTISFRVIVL